MNGISEKELIGWLEICEQHPNLPQPISGRKLGEYVAEIRRLRADLEYAMQIGGVNYCAGCKTKLVLSELEYCSECRT